VNSRPIAMSLRQQQQQQQQEALSQQWSDTEKSTARSPELSPARKQSPSGSIAGAGTGLYCLD